jgi:hypothetical protein
MNRRNFLKLIGIAAIFPKDGIKYLSPPPKTATAIAYSVPHPGWQESVLSIEEYYRLYIEPATRKLAENIDKDIMGLQT